MFVVWLQYAMLPADLPAPAKAFLVFAGSVVLSWPASIAVSRLLNGTFAFAAKRPIRTAAR